MTLVDNYSDSELQPKHELPVIVKVDTNYVHHSEIENFQIEDNNLGTDPINLIRQKISINALKAKQKLEDCKGDTNLLGLPINSKRWVEIEKNLELINLDIIYFSLSKGKGEEGLTELSDYKKFKKTEFDTFEISQKVSQYDELLTKLIQIRIKLDEKKEEQNTSNLFKIFKFWKNSGINQKELENTLNHGLVELKDIEAKIKNARKTALYDTQLKAKSLVDVISEIVKYVVEGNSDSENAFLIKGQLIFDTDLIYLDGSINLNIVTTISDLIIKVETYLNNCTGLAGYDHTQEIK